MAENGQFWPIFGLKPGFDRIKLVHVAHFLKAFDKLRMIRRYFVLIGAF